MTTTVTPFTTPTTVESTTMLDNLTTTVETTTTTLFDNLTSVSPSENETVNYWQQLGYLTDQEVSLVLQGFLIETSFLNC